MPEQGLPTKPARDAKAAIPSSDGPAKGEADEAAAVRQVADRPTKEPFAADQEDRTTDPGKDGQPPEFDNQEPRREPGDKGGDGYLRITVRADHGRFFVVDSHRVEGPLAQEQALLGRFAYDITAGGRLLHAGSIPDLGEYRSFASPSPASEEQIGHHRYQLETYEFDARVPLARLRDTDLGAVVITLYQVKEPDPVGAAPRDLGPGPLGRSRERQLREIGRVEGLPRGVIEGKVPPPEAREGAEGRPSATKLRSPQSDEDGEVGA